MLLNSRCQLYALHPIHLLVSLHTRSSVPVGALPACQTDEETLNMETFPAPPGKAGWYQLHAMIESVQSELEQMFSQRAKLDSLTCGVGR